MQDTTCPVRRAASWTHFQLRDANLQPSFIRSHRIPLCLGTLHLQTRVQVCGASCRAPRGPGLGLGSQRRGCPAVGAAMELCTEIIPKDYFNPPADVGLVVPAPAHAEGRSSARRARCSGQTGYSSRPNPLSELFAFLAAQCRDILIYFLKQIFVTILED